MELYLLIIIFPIIMGLLASASVWLWLKVGEIKKEKEL
jgi:hypothetical protein